MVGVPSSLPLQVGVHASMVPPTDPLVMLSLWDLSGVSTLTGEWVKMRITKPHFPCEIRYNLSCCTSIVVENSPMDDRYVRHGFHWQGSAGLAASVVVHQTVALASRESGLAGQASLNQEIGRRRVGKECS